MKINVIGTIFCSTGYDIHTRQLINALCKVADVKLSTQLFPGWERQVNDAELDMILKPERTDDYNLIVTTPHNWKMYTGMKKNIGYCVWEGDKVPESWIDEFLNPDIDLIFVPSKHTKDAIENTFGNKESLSYTYCMNKVKIVPHGVDLTLFHKTVNENKPFIFLCSKGWRGTSWDRGGVQYVLKAFNEEFTKDDKVELLVKLNQAYINSQTLNQAMTGMNLVKDRATIKITLDDVPYEKLYKLYNQCDVYVCATRAEAFNLPGIEAMACGLPVIQTGYGGQTDYMTPQNSLTIDYKLELVKDDIMYEGIQWATPDIEDLKKKMRWAFENQEEMKEKGKQSLEDSKNWTWDISASKAFKFLSEINQ